MISNNAMPKAPGWSELVNRVQSGEEAALGELYDHLARWTRPYLLRALGREAVDDRIHDAYLAVVQEIQEGGLRDPRALMPFVFGVVRNIAAAQIARKVRHQESELDHLTASTVRETGPDPEQQAGTRERHQRAGQILSKLTPRDREILIRFYIFEQKPQAICTRMGLTETQFRLYKSRAMARLERLRREDDEDP